MMFGKGRNEMYYYTYVYNADSGELLVENLYSLPVSKASEALVKTMMYDNFLKLSN